jgi:RNA polymerase sigma-70 factor (ECF subfamily)
MEHPSAPTPVRSPFVTTHWSVVIAARDKDSPGSAAALEALCRAYWYPLYAFVRRTGKSPEDAQDLTQEFFARLLKKDYLRAADPEKGRFRTFLRVALKHFLANEWDRSRRVKRGGGLAHVSFDTQLAEQRYQTENVDSVSPDRLYERRWALTLLKQVLDRLQEEYSAAGKLTEFEELKTYLTADRGSIPYPELSNKLKASEGSVRLSVHRLRKRFRAVFRAEVADTVAAIEDIDEELRYIAQILAGV